MPVAVLAVTFAEMLAAAIRRRRQTQNAFARDLGVAGSTLSRYLRGSRPEYFVCQRFAEMTGIPEEDVLRAAGLLSSSEPPANEDPPWLAELIAELRAADLTPRETDVLDATVQGLLQLREERERYGALPPTDPEAPPAP